MDLNTYKTDRTKDLEGAWIELGDGARLLVASVQSPTYKKVIRKRLKGIPGHLLKADPEMQDKIIGEVMAEFILLDWEGITEDGLAVKPTLENRKKAMKLPHFREVVAELATDISVFQAEDEAADVAAIKSDTPVGTEARG
jgi:hypothetical protein